MRRIEQIPLPKEEIVALYRDGETCRKLAVQFGVCAETISRRLRDWGVQPHPRGYRSELLAEELPIDDMIRQYVTEQLSLRAVAELHYVSTMTVRKLLLESGVKMRSKGFRS